MDVDLLCMQLGFGICLTMENHGQENVLDNTHLKSYIPKTEFAWSLQ